MPLSIYFGKLGLDDWPQWCREDVVNDDKSKYSYRYVSNTQTLPGRGCFTPINPAGAGVDRDSSFEVRFTTETRTVDVEDKLSVPEEFQGILNWDVSRQQLHDRLAANTGGRVSQVPQYTASTILGTELPVTIQNRAIHVSAHGTRTPLFKGVVPDACGVGLFNSDGSDYDAVFDRCAMTVEVNGDTSELV